MKIIENSETFVQIVNSYRHEKKHCSTNLLLMQDKINDLIDAGKLYYDLIDGILWFFEKNNDFYIAYFYLPKEEKLKLIPQDLDVIVEIVGNQVRYNIQWEMELLESGFEKYNRYIEIMAHKEQCQSMIEKQVEKIHSFVERMGCYRRTATKADYDKMYQLWRTKIDRYAIRTLTEKELDEMERSNRGYLICNDKNEICVAGYYSRTDNTANTGYLVSLYKGFGAVASYERMASMFREGCDRYIGWTRENNTDMLMIARKFAVETGKFSQQFLMRKVN